MDGSTGNGKLKGMIECGERRVEDMEMHGSFFFGVEVKAVVARIKVA